jgi:hypothetical protein
MITSRNADRIRRIFQPEMKQAELLDKHEMDGAVMTHDMAYAKCQKAGCPEELIIRNDEHGTLRVIARPVGRCRGNS